MFSIDGTGSWCLEKQWGFTQWQQCNGSESVLLYVLYFFFIVISYFCLFIYERDFCDINHAQWRWGRGADLSTTRRPHINIRRIRGNLLLLNYPDENQSNKDWFIVGWEKSKLMNGNKHFGHLLYRRAEPELHPSSPFSWKSSFHPTFIPLACGFRLYYLLSNTSIIDNGGTQPKHATRNMFKWGKLNWFKEFQSFWEMHAVTTK